MPDRTILDMFRLDGRVAIVTGASSGLGAVFARTLAEAGADVALGARRVDRLTQTRQAVEATGRRAIAVATDVTRPEDCQALVDATTAEFGRVDVLVNNAGVGTAVPATRETPEQFRSVIDVNLNGCYWMAQACGQVMQPGSSIVNISSILGLTTAGLPQAAYAASKAGLIGLTQALAVEFGPKGIRVNALLPGGTDTPLAEAWVKTPEALAFVEGLHALKRRAHPDEIARSALYLASDASSFTTGTALLADGGVSINRT
jgi:NAD(P)-dependent dehydrogenase (short-subunit alcohol dehydrogenase family)